VVVTAAPHTVPLADAISEADYKRERRDANEQSHSRQRRIGRAVSYQNSPFAVLFASSLRMGAGKPPKGLFGRLEFIRGRSNLER
jgi:hypothetical protein